MNSRILKSVEYPSEIYKELGETITRGDIWQGELINKKKNGALYWVFATISPIKDENETITHFVAINDDIPERKHAEAELQKAKKAAEVANQAKSVFLANMNHELRSPLNAILGFSQLMAQDANLTPVQQEYLTTIGHSGEHLLFLINEVLELSKIEAGRAELHPENFDLHRMLTELEEMICLSAADKSLELSFKNRADVPQYVRADKNKLRQVLINLLGNAVKFTEKGRVALCVSGNNFCKESDNLPKVTCGLHFEVEDTGAGIAPDELKDVFVPFVQTASGQQSQQGTGLGLSISQEHVRLMGGELYVESTFGVGSTFKFDMPVEVVSDSQVATELPRRQVVGLLPGQPVYRILVVEDADASRLLLVRFLESAGFVVHEAVNGMEAVKITQKWQPHLIWMDIRMPEMNDYETIEIIKAQQSELRKRKTVIIALTASALEDDRKKIKAAGYDDFLLKPFQKEDIFEIMRKYIGAEYVYAETPIRQVPTAVNAVPPVSDLGALISDLPSDLLENLEQATIIADMERISALIAQVRDYDDPLADALDVLADDFKYNDIADLIWNTKENYNE